MAHGSNDGQKGMGLILLVLIGFLPGYYALDLKHPGQAAGVLESATSIRQRFEQSGEPIPKTIAASLDTIESRLAGRVNLSELPIQDRWSVRRAIFNLSRAIESHDVPDGTRNGVAPMKRRLDHAIEYVPTWVIFGVALALGVGTTVGYKRIVVTVAEKIGKAHLSYAQGAAAEVVAAGTILMADLAHMPVSTTQVLSSGVAGTMWANNSGVQANTLRRIGTAWVLTLPASMLLAASLFTLSHWPGAATSPGSAPVPAVAAQPVAPTPPAPPVTSPHIFSIASFTTWNRP
jgi:phosphate/sulfate permease